MNRRGKIIVSVVGIFLVLLILVGLTYAYFLTKIQGNTKSKSITVKTANLALVYGDGNGIIEPTDPIVPGTTIASKTFTVTNNGDSTVNDYIVVLENVYNELVRPQDLVYKVECTSSDDKTCNGVSTETPFPSGKGSVDAGEGFGIVVVNSIDKDVVHTYTITLKYLNVDVDQSDDMNKTIQGKINIKDGNEINPYKSQNGTLANAIINNAVNLTSEQKSLGYAEFRTTPLTTPAVEISSENESELTLANDDYGVSYYYRGNVKNNYLTFNNMCWRIVRIEGDGAVKLVLADSSAGCSENTTASDSASIGTGDYGYTRDYVTNSSGETSVSRNVIINYLSGEKSSMKTKLDTWITSSSIDISKLKQDTWCLGNTTDLYDKNGTLLTTDKNDLMYDGVMFYYKAFIRLYGKGQARNATYNCNGENDENYTSYIGTLTADEVVYAGGKSGSSNSNFFLRENAMSGYWWTLTPSIFGGANDSVIDLNNGLVTYNSINGSFNIRPAISLATGIKFIDGDGSIDNPYIVK